MTIFDTLKDLAGLAQKAGSMDLYRQAVELMQQVTEQQQQITLLNDKVNSLTEQLRLRDEMTFRDNAYWKLDSTGPFCSRCFEADVKVIRLHGSQPNSTKQVVYYICPVCQTRTQQKASVRLSDLQKQQRGTTITHGLT